MKEKINLRELRIGNYVYDTLGKVNKIDLEAITYIVKEPHNQVKPIPLTEEWLLKFGFYKSMSWTYAIELKGNLKLVYYLGEKGWSIGFKSYSDFSNLEYVHQLQNLYFALTGNELTIKAE